MTVSEDEDIGQKQSRLSQKAKSVSNVCAQLDVFLSHIHSKGEVYYPQKSHREPFILSSHSGRSPDYSNPLIAPLRCKNASGSIVQEAPYFILIHHFESTIDCAMRLRTPDNSLRAVSSLPNFGLNVVLLICAH